MRFRSAALSDQGFARDNNEDLVHADDERGFFVVIDGMGGQAAGEEAARIAMERIRGRLERPSGTAEERAREAITLANNAIWQAAQSREQWKGMACVLTLAILEDGGRLTIGHVGDTRLYKLRGTAIEKLTHDHSPVGEREDKGELNELAAMDHPRRNEVYRDVGSQEHDPDDEQFIEVTHAVCEPDAALLLCTDGLTDVVSSERIRRIVEECAGDRTLTARRLIEAANENSKDNVSVIFVEGEQFAATFGLYPRRRKLIYDMPADTAPSRSRLGDSGVPEPRASASEPEPPRRSWLRHPALLVGIGVLLGLALGQSPKLVDRAVAFWREQFPPGPQKLVVSRSGIRTIAAALERARPGDLIEIAPGEYREHIQLKDGVDVVSQVPRKAVLLPPRSIEAAAAIRADRVTKCRVLGLTIGEDAGGAFAIGVASTDSTLDLEHLEISGTKVAAVELGGASRGTLRNNYIHHNSGPALVVRQGAAADLENNILVRNGTAKAHLGPGIVAQFASDLRVVKNTIADNGAEAIWTTQALGEAMLDTNQFTLDGSPGTRRRMKIISGEEYK